MLKMLTNLLVKRKNIGKDCERIIAEFENYELPQYE